MAAAGTNNSARALLEQGLARYGRGQIAQALDAWREALAVDPGNEEARKLVQFVEERLARAGESASDRATSEMPAVGGRERDTDLDVDAEDDRKDTNPEVERSTEENLPTVEPDREPEFPRKRRATLVSALPAILAPSTRLSDRGATPVPPRPAVRQADRVTRVAPTVQQTPAPTVQRSPAPAAQRSAAPPSRNAVPSSVPIEQSEGSVTRPIGSDRATPPQGVRSNATFRSDTPLDMALTLARQRASVMVDECRARLDAGNIEKAAAAAEEALEEGDKAPMPGIAEVIEPARGLFEQSFAAHVGPEVAVPVMAVDMSTINTSAFDHKTGFLLSCIDGTLPVHTLLDISGMGRFECLRTLSRLLRKGIITFG